MYYAALLLLPCVLLVLAVWRVRTYSLTAAAITLVGCLLIASVGLGIDFYGATTDTEIWSGRIVSKTRDEVSCEHSYTCHCHTVVSLDSKGNATTHTECETCYEHPYDVDWDLGFSTGRTISIDRIDRQGLEEPPRWDAAYVGEPTAESHDFTNYLLGAPNSVLLDYSAPPEYAKLVPRYPDSVGDYYHCNRVLVSGGVPVQNMKAWEWLLDNLNADLGGVKQVNVIVVITGAATPSYEYALSKAWVGGKKNDLIVAISSKNYPAIDWVRIVSWTTDASIKVYLRDDIERIGSLDQRDAIMSAIRAEVRQRYTRKHMKSLRYLAASRRPSTTALVLITIFELALTLGSIAFVASEESSYHHYYD